MFRLGLGVFVMTTGFFLLGVSASPAEEKIFQCRDAEGNPVKTVEMKDMKTMSRAAIDSADSSPVVLKNSTILSWIKEETRVFFFAHECAHHALGHTIAAQY
ncbi:MAG TPA: hypothetical protein VLB09_00105, partial [Nitrospiria bacterium]|nr:hypothetical protein [Nitrospiria bacterium]